MASEVQICNLALAKIGDQQITSAKLVGCVTLYTNRCEMLLFAHTRGILLLQEKP